MRQRRLLLAVYPVRWKLRIKKYNVNGKKNRGREQARAASTRCSAVTATNLGRIAQNRSPHKLAHAHPLLYTPSIVDLGCLRQVFAVTDVSDGTQ